MKNEEGRYLDMYSSEVRLGDSVIAPSKNIIGEVSDFAENDKLEVETKFIVNHLSNGEVQLVRVEDGNYSIFESTELITRTTRPFYSVYE